MSRAASANRLFLRDQKTSLGFNNTNTSVAYSGAAVTGFDSASSFSAWVKLRSGSANLRQIIARWGDGSSKRATLCFQQAVALGSERYNIQAGYWNGTAYTLSGDVIVRPNVWFHVAVTWDGTTMRAYLNGVLLGGTCASPASGVTTGLNLGNQSGANGFCLQSRVKLYTRVLSQADITNLAMLNDEAVSTSGLWVAWDLNDGAGNATDTSENGRTGTISNGVFVNDTPTKKRKDFNINPVYNGDFEYIPPFTAGTTTASRWIDGTSGGSSSNDLFGWFLSANWTGSDGTASFDSSTFYSGLYSLKINKTSATGGTAGGAVGLGTLVSPSSAIQKQYFIPVVPGREYQLTCRLKTDSISNLNTAGARIRALMYDGINTTSVSSASSSYVRGTNDWQLVTVTFTPGATVNFVNIWCQLDNETGTAWFDEVSLLPTIPLVRSQAAVRAASA